MLVLSRRAGESLVIGDQITVSVLSVRGGVIRLGIDAPRSVAVHRSEILEQPAQTLPISEAVERRCIELCEGA